MTKETPSRDSQFNPYAPLVVVAVPEGDGELKRDVAFHEFWSDLRGLAGVAIVIGLIVSAVVAGLLVDPFRFLAVFPGLVFLVLSLMMFQADLRAVNWFLYLGYTSLIPQFLLPLMLLGPAATLLFLLTGVISLIVFMQAHRVKEKAKFLQQKGVDLRTGRVREPEQENRG